MAKEKMLSYTQLSEVTKADLKGRIHVIINTKKFMQLEKKKCETSNPKLLQDSEMQLAKI